MPVVADSEFLRQSRKNGKLRGSKTLQDLSWCGAPTTRCIRGNKSALVDCRIRSGRRIAGHAPTELFEDVCKLVAGVGRHDKIRALRNRIRRTVEHIRFASSQAIHSRGLAGFRVTAIDYRKSEHVIKSSVLEHKYEDVLYGHRELSPPSGSNRCVSSFGKLTGETVSLNLLQCGVHRGGVSLGAEYTGCLFKQMWIKHKICTFE